MAIDLGPALERATSAAREAGDLLRADLHRPGGPRGGGDKAEADTEAERLIRDRLLPAFAGWAFLGEETGAVAGDRGAPLWCVDPNDGTRDYLKGRRGSAVSIALLVDRVPRLGVVHAFAYPDDDGDLFAWAEGCGPVRRNGRPCDVVPARGLASDSVVLVSSAGDTDAAGNLECVRPARYRTVPSIAHRLALVAAGEAAVAVSINWPGAWDYAAGHALLRGAGGVLVDEKGREVVYGEGGASRTVCAFGGREEAVRALVGRGWERLGMSVRSRGSSMLPARLRPGRAVADASRLSRAEGCLLGQVAGDNLGALVEFASAGEIARAHPDGGPRALVDGGRWDILAGQPTDDSEMALALARSILEEDRFEPKAARRAYRAWLDSGPFDVGSTVGGALRGRANPASQANGALMRASPLGVLAHALLPAEAAALARADAVLTHVHPACGDASAAFVVAVAHAIREGDGAEAAWQAAARWAREAGGDPLVTEALAAARDEAPACDGPKQGWVRIALQNAFFELLHASSLEEGVVATVRRGGDTDTNAAIAGALLGAVHGRKAVPAQWRSMVLSCRPLDGAGRRPRPREYWPVDVLEIAERLLLAGGVAANDEGRR
jgi:ADP-ribosylglycohydrolase/fructose-1,6-bisphosphatase/inositol monophosphatase family enzyme